MSRKCDVANVKVASGNKVSHSNRKTKRKFNPNLHAVTLLSDTLKQKIRLRVAVRTLKTIEFKGGLDSFLLSQSARKLTEKALNLKNKIKKKLVSLEISQEKA